MQKQILGYAEILHSELEYVRWRLEVVKEERLLDKYRKEEAWLNQQIVQLRTWIDNQQEGEDG